MSFFHSDPTGSRWVRQRFSPNYCKPCTMCRTCFRWLAMVRKCGGASFWLPLRFFCMRRCVYNRRIYDCVHSLGSLASLLTIFLYLLPHHVLAVTVYYCNFIQDEFFYPF
ncbi:hypothetical protein F5050DRAFT_642440 [Lentinula boryana]|uniref:Uncharacterized protein n=1 Tax=Lentinula boryana TaxID=40481 RepID=A0ABQ8Q5M6_9AGAR|nr:hypothetical protein F5050DRAFT_642440 [Lentinula boryana]